MTTIKNFIGTRVIYDSDGASLFGVNEEGQHQIIADIRGWGAIQNLFANSDGTIREFEAMAFQDELGEFIANAINEKLKNED